MLDQIILFIVGHCEIIDLVDSLGKELAATQSVPLIMSNSKDNKCNQTVKKLEREIHQLRLLSLTVK